MLKSRSYVITFIYLFLTMLISQESAIFLTRDELFEVTNMSIYYDVLSNKALEMTDAEPESAFKQSGGEPQSEAIENRYHFKRIAFRSNGCNCLDLTCGCCFGMNITQFNFDRTGCMNLTYDPQEFAIVMNMLWNGESVYTNSVSGKNPPPICIPVPMPYIPNVDFCAKLFNIFTPGRNIHMCLDVETRIQRAPVLVLHFDCMRMGSDGVALVKPEDNGGLPTTTEFQSGADVYDEVTEIKYRNNSNLQHNTYPIQNKINKLAAK